MYRNAPRLTTVSAEPIAVTLISALPLPNLLNITSWDSVLTVHAEDGLNSTGTGLLSIRQQMLRCRGTSLRNNYARRNAVRESLLHFRGTGRAEADT